ncbi:histidinol-phosphatase HisJ family protein [Candidatus Stoquefichus massiliensis]|uniref:histidinol-phosphatase HisJ family protein n=1 Tax=Candidatus Stoquefichus massiliensis TaxID=1470350 RepID=UPI0004890813|nr:histidinol-phosphatase HisJ family protein [Candidatus Stoquefichus massiliensis]
MYCDYHVHTDYSDDSTYLIEDVIKDAIDKGIDEICITDHVDYGIKDDWEEVEIMIYRDGMPLANVDYPRWEKELTGLQQVYQDQIKIKMGMEFGMQVHTIHQYQKLFQRYPFDFIILSVHQVEDKEFWTQDFQRGRTQQEYIERYYQEMLELVKIYKDYSVLGHMDLIVRYDENGLYPFERIKPMIQEILKIVIEDGKGIEVNTSYHRYGLNDMTPSRDILRLYNKLGGKIITIGSDSHKKEHLGAYIEETKDELKKLGFEYYCTYEQMRPFFHKL